MDLTKKIIIVLVILIVVSLGIYLFLNISYRKEINGEYYMNDDTNKLNENQIEQDNDENLSESKIVVVLETSKGDIEIELFSDDSPITVENFLSYVDAGHYDGLVFHRVMKGFMIQGGGFDANGKQKSTRAPIVLESNNGLKNNVGTIAMARTNVNNSATSQFFINTVDNDFLNYSAGNPGYAVFGKVISGMDIVHEIEDVLTTTKYGMQNWPEEDVFIIKAYRK